MKILALYTTPTLSLLRRVLAPYSCLAQRGHPFSFLAVPSLEAGLGQAHGHDVTVLPNWDLSVDEVRSMAEIVRAGKTFVYDLSDPALLGRVTIRQAMRLVALVTVPNEYLAREVRSIVHAATPVAVTPSVIDIPYFMTGHQKNVLPFRLPSPTIGCFGPHDWEIVKPALTLLREKRPHISIIGDAHAHNTLGDLVTPVDLTLESYPQLVNACTFGLCPYDGIDGRETLWAHEYGILYKPVIASAESAYPYLLGGAAQIVTNKLPERWVDAILSWLSRPELRAHAGKGAFVVANEQRATRKADIYLKIITSLLPHLAIPV